MSRDLTAPVSHGDAETAGLTLGRVFPFILLPIFLAVVDGTIVAAALPTMTAAFGEVERLPWVVVAYLLASTVAAPVYGRLGDALGRRRLLMAALVLFIGASVLCACAQGLLSLVAARMLQGFGGGGLMVLSQAVLGENTSRRQLGRAQGWLAAVITAGSTFGPVAGGVLTQLAGWRAVFLVNLPLGGLALLLALRLPARRRGSDRGRFDWLGLALFAGAVVPLLLALGQLQRLELAGLPVTVGLLLVAAACLVALLWQERRVSAPLFPLGLLRQPAMWRANGMAACSGALLVSEATILPIHLQAVDGVSAGHIGLLMLPLTVTVSIGSIVTGRLITSTGRVAIFPAVGQSLAALGLVAVALGGPAAGAAFGPWGLPAMLAAVALFQGSGMPVAQITVQSQAPPALLGAAAASVQLSRSVGSAVGVTVAIAVLFAMVGRDAQVAGAFADAVRHGPDAGRTMSSAAGLGMQAHFAAGFSAAFLTVGAFAATSALLAWTLPLRRL